MTLRWGVSGVCFSRILLHVTRDLFFEKAQSLSHNMPQPHPATSHRPSLGSCAPLLCLTRAQRGSERSKRHPNLARRILDFHAAKGPPLGRYRAQKKQQILRGVCFYFCYRVGLSEPLLIMPRSMFLRTRHPKGVSVICCAGVHLIQYSSCLWDSHPPAQEKLYTFPSPSTFRIKTHHKPLSLHVLCTKRVVN